MTEAIVAAERVAATAAVVAAAELAAGQRPAATVGAAVRKLARAAAGAAVDGEDALAVDALLARRARVRVRAGMRTRPALAEACRDEQVAAALDESPPLEDAAAQRPLIAAVGLAVPDARGARTAAEERAATEAGGGLARPEENDDDRNDDGSMGEHTASCIGKDGGKLEASGAWPLASRPRRP